MVNGQVTQFTLAWKIGILAHLLSFPISFLHDSSENTDRFSRLSGLFSHCPGISVTWLDLEQGDTLFFLLISAVIPFNYTYGFLF